MAQEMHQMQVAILKKLLFAPAMKYSDLRVHDDMENNALNFHLKQLQTLELVAHTGEAYTLTPKGKEFAGRIDTDVLKIMRQSKLGVWLCCTRTIGNETEYLVYTRLKQPFYGCQGWMSGKIAYGESVRDTAQRELFEETGLTGEPELVAIKHYRVFDIHTKELLEDKIMFLHRVKNPTGKLIANDEGKHEWVRSSSIAVYITKPFETIEAMQQQLYLMQRFDGTVQWSEEAHHTGKF